MAGRDLMTSLVFNFLLGGSIVASVSYIGDQMSPLLGAIWWSFPLSLLPSLYFMRSNGKSNAYLAQFSLSTTYALPLLASSTMCLAFLLGRSKDGFAVPIMKTTAAWLALSAVFYVSVKRLGLERVFV